MRPNACPLWGIVRDLLRGDVEAPLYTSRHGTISKLMRHAIDIPVQPTQLLPHSRRGHCAYHSDEDVNKNPADRYIMGGEELVDFVTPHS